MALNAFLKIDGINGESKNSKFQNTIEIITFGFAAAQTGTSKSGGGAGHGAVAMDDFFFTVLPSTASPKLLTACAGGDHIKTATLSVCKAGKDQQEYITYKFTDILISSFKTNVGSPSAPAGDKRQTAPTSDDWQVMEHVQFNFSKIEYAYKEQGSDGTMKGAINGGWDVKQNKSV